MFAVTNKKCVQKKGNEQASKIKIINEFETLTHVLFLFSTAVYY